MATRIHSGQSRKTRSRESVFNWENGNAGALVGAAVAGAAVGIAANVGRKFFVQFAGGATDWIETLKAEHAQVIAVFDKIESLGEERISMRGHLLTKLKNMLAKHTAEEEMVIYPALRQANKTGSADRLNADHGYMKTYLYELETMAHDDPLWLARLSDFRTMLEEHIREEEDDIFPEFRGQLTAEQNAKLTSMVNKEGFRLA